MNEGIQGKVVLIIGGAGGIGSATASMLASKGATIAIADIDRSKSEGVVAAIRAAGGTAEQFKVDVTNKDEVKDVANAVVRAFGKIDVLINSAGVMLIRPMNEVDTSEWDLTIDLNVK